MKHLNTLIQWLILVGLGVAFTSGCVNGDTKTAVNAAQKVLQEADRVCSELKPALSALVIDYRSFCALSKDYQVNLPPEVLYEVTRLCSLPPAPLTEHVELVCSGI